MGTREKYQERLNLLLGLVKNLARVSVDQNVFARCSDGLVEVSLVMELGVCRHDCFCAFFLLPECSEYAELDVMIRKFEIQGLRSAYIRLLNLDLLANLHGIEWNHGCNTYSGERGWASSRVESGP